MASRREIQTEIDQLQSKIRYHRSIVVDTTDEEWVAGYEARLDRLEKQIRKVQFTPCVDTPELNPDVLLLIFMLLARGTWTHVEKVCTTWRDIVYSAPTLYRKYISSQLATFFEKPALVYNIDRNIAACTVSSDGNITYQIVDKMNLVRAEGKTVTHQINVADIVRSTMPTTDDYPYAVHLRGGDLYVLSDRACLTFVAESLTLRSIVFLSADEVTHRITHTDGLTTYNEKTDTVEIFEPRTLRQVNSCTYRFTPREITTVSGYFRILAPVLPSGRIRILTDRGHLIEELPATGCTETCQYSRYSMDLIHNKMVIVTPSHLLVMERGGTKKRLCIPLNGLTMGFVDNSGIRINDTWYNITR